MQVVDTTIAAEEIENWLDAKRVGRKKRESYAEMIDTLVDAVSEGTISIGDDRTITHKLLFPVGDGELAFDELKYKPRITVQEVNVRLKGVKSGDGDGRIMAYVAALTGKSTGLLQKIDTEDMSIAQAVAVFFL